MPGIQSESISVDLDNLSKKDELHKLKDLNMELPATMGLKHLLKIYRRIVNESTPIDTFSTSQAKVENNSSLGTINSAAAAAI